MCSCFPSSLGFAFEAFKKFGKCRIIKYNMTALRHRFYTIVSGVFVTSALLAMFGFMLLVSSIYTSVLQKAGLDGGS